VAKELMEKHGWTQMQISKELGITQAAVSKYRSGKLDGKVKEFANLNEVKEAAEEIAEKIASGEIRTPKSVNRICLLCMSMRKSGKLCEFHLDMKKLKECDVCL